MIVPDLKPWMEQSHPAPADRVACHDAIAFGVVADRTGEAKIVSLGWAAKRWWDDVIDLKRFRAKFLLQPAVFATVASALGCEPSQSC